MAVPKISLLEENTGTIYKCQMCKTVTRKGKFLWKSWFTDSELEICRECAYREKFGTRNMLKSKRERILEKKEINQKAS